jgi:hypothetical protein
MGRYRVLTISLCHNSPEIIRESIAQYYRTKSQEVDTHHVLVHQHWPVRPHATAKALEQIAKEFGCQLIDPGKNLGLARGFNWALDQVSFPNNGGVIGYDPDSWPVTLGWDLALCEVMVHRPGTVWASLYHQHAFDEVHGRGKLSQMGRTQGVKWESIKQAAMNSVCMFSRGWLREIGGLHEEHRFYGGLEVCTWPKIPKEGWVFLPEYEERPKFFDEQEPLYKAWKWRSHHSAASERVTGSFAEFLAREKPELLNG